jgi:AcrR family transcriptional regulator
MLSNPPVEEKLDPRIKRTRALIEQAFLEMLTEKGFHAITVQDITARAEINRATFYAHFSDKYALLDHSIRQEFHRELEKRTLSACHYSEDNLKAVIVTVCEFIAWASVGCKSSDNQFESLLETQVKKQVQELLQLWLEQTSCDVEPSIAATAASWAVYGLALKWNHDKNRPPVEEFASQVLPLIISNLRLLPERA